MTHTSGLPYGFNPAEVIDGLFIAQRTKSLEAKGAPKNSAEVVADFFELPLAFQPGTKWRYGNFVSFSIL
jgi:CubicO group peptidase (beta-lactamase class C family)